MSLINEIKLYFTGTGGEDVLLKTVDRGGLNSTPKEMEQLTYRGFAKNGSILGSIEEQLISVGTNFQFSIEIPTFTPSKVLYITNIALHSVVANGNNEGVSLISLKRVLLSSGTPTLDDPIPGASIERVDSLGVPSDPGMTFNEASFSISKAVEIANTTLSYYNPQQSLTVNPVATDHLRPEFPFRLRENTRNFFQIENNEIPQVTEGGTDAKVSFFFEATLVDVSDIPAPQPLTFTP